MACLWTLLLPSAAGNRQQQHQRCQDDGRAQGASDGAAPRCASPPVFAASRSSSFVPSAGDPSGQPGACASTYVVRANPYLLFHHRKPLDEWRKFLPWLP